MELTLKKSYLPIGTKKQICQTIADNSITCENGMAFIDHITMQISIDMSLLQFYYEIDIADIDMDKLYEDGTIQVAKDGVPISELDFIDDNSWHIIKQRVATYNSLSGMINRNIQTLLDRIPTDKEMNKLLNKLPKTLEKINPETLEILKGVMDKKI